MLEAILGFAAEVLFEFLVSAAVRWIVRKMRITGVHDRALRWLEDKKFRPPADALTEREIVRHAIVKSVDPIVIPNEVKKRIQSELAHWGLIRKEWDPDLSTPLLLEWKKFFVRLSSFLAEVIVPRLNDQYKDANIACFVTLPFPRERKHRPVETFEQAFEKCLGSRPIYREFVTPAMLQRKVGWQWLSQLRERERILVLQPVAMDDEYLEKTLGYISECSVGTVYEVVTLVDGSGRPIAKRSGNPPERVLVELNLSFIGQ